MQKLNEARGACVQIVTQANKKSISSRFDPWYLRGCPPNWTVTFEGLFGRYAPLQLHGCAKHNEKFTFSALPNFRFHRDSTLGISVAVHRIGRSILKVFLVATRPCNCTGPHKMHARCHFGDVRRVTTQPTRIFEDLARLIRTVFGF